MTGQVRTVDGRVAGTWRRTLGRAGVAIELATFAPVPPRQRAAILTAARRYANFLGVAARPAPRLRSSG